MTAKPRTDGLYRTAQSKALEMHGEEGMPYWNYLRFYPDGRVISTSTTGTPAQIAAWFAQEVVNDTYLPMGDYRADGHTFSFTTQARAENVDKDGYEYETRVEYMVTIQDDNANLLQVQSYSHINGHRGTELYEFVSMDDS
ncbi:MAG: hypothetical protein M3441_06215 [Chloroflexota bacterium]|nr:hypothetical protein [Chloroflexota bacterium]